MELLEKRLAPAGLVTALLSSGTLKLIGDSADNALTVKEIGLGAFEITGSAGTLISLNGGEAADSVTVAQVTKALNFDLKAGADTLTLHDITFAGSISAQLGAGNNALNLENLDLGGSLSITGGSDYDTVSALTGTLHIGGSTHFALGDGSNTVSFTGLDSVFFGGAVSYTGGNLAESLMIEAGSVEFASGLTMKTGLQTGDTLLSLNASGALRIGGPLTFQSATAHAASTVTLQGDVIEVQSGISIKHGSGSNTTLIQAAEHLTIGGAVAITNGNTYFASTNLNAPELSIAGSLTIINGTGGKDNFLTGAITVGGNVVINNGAGHAVTGISGTSLNVGGSLSVTNGAGLANNEIFSDDIHIGGKLTFSNAGTGTASNGALGDNYLQAVHLKAGAISIINGKGSFNTVLNIANGGAASVSIINGPTSPAGAGSDAGTTYSGVYGDWQVDRDITISNGSGRYHSEIASQGNIVAGGAISIVTTAGSLQNYIAADHLLARSLTIHNGSFAANPDPGAMDNFIQVGSLDISGAFSIINGNSVAGASGNKITNVIEVAHSAELGSVTIRNGRGVSENTITASSFDVHGGVSISSGAAATGVSTHSIFSDLIHIGGTLNIQTGGGDTSTQIQGADVQLGKVALTYAGRGVDNVMIGGGAALSVMGGIAIRTNSGATENSVGSSITEVLIGGDAMTHLNLLGGVNFTASDGENEVMVHGNGRIVGNVNAAMGASSFGNLQLSGNLETLAGLNVTGQVSVTGGAATFLHLGLADGAFGAVTFNGGHNVNSVTLDQVQMHGPVMLSLGAGDDSVRINDATFDSRLSIDMGAGADTVSIEDIDFFNGMTSFMKDVKINLGAGNDTLNLAVSEVAQATFHSAISLDGGTGTNLLQTGPNIAYTVPAKIKNFETP